MTQGKSLVEDMARANLASDLIAAVLAHTSIGNRVADDAPALRIDMAAARAAALSVLKDRLPADDRELVVEAGLFALNLKSIAKRERNIGNAELLRVIDEAALFIERQAADRIIA